MEWLAEAWTWIMANGIYIVAALLAISEALSLIPQVKSNGVFLWLVTALKWVKGKLGG